MVDGIIEIVGIAIFTIASFVVLLDMLFRR